MVELMHEHGLHLANSFFQHSLEETITYRDFGVKQHEIGTANQNRLAQLDVMLVPGQWMPKVRDVKSLPLASLGTQHFPICATLDISIKKSKGRSNFIQKDVSALHAW